MQAFNAKAIGCNRILRLFKQRKNRVIFLQVGPGVRWQQPVAPFSWSSAPSPSSKSWEVENRCEYSWRKLNNEALSVEADVKYIWWYDNDMMCVYIYITIYITYHMMFQSFWPSNTGVVLVVTVMSIAVALIPLPAALLWVRASTKNTPLKGCFVKTSVFWLTNLFELFDVGVILIWWFY